MGIIEGHEVTSEHARGDYDQCEAPLKCSRITLKIRETIVSSTKPLCICQVTFESTFETIKKI